MASIIRVKRSTGTAAPGSLAFGELGVTIGAGAVGNKGERLFVGDDGGNIDVIGGKYYTDMLTNGPGQVASRDNPATPANGFIPILLTENGGNPGQLGAVARLPRVDQWSVDNLTIDGNTIYSNNNDGDINLYTNGSGHVVIPDDKKLTFGTSKDSSIEYDENGTDKVLVTGADWVFNNAMQISGGVSIDNVGISSNIISTLSGGGNTLYIDPYPDGLSSDGIVIV